MVHLDHRTWKPALIAVFRAERARFVATPVRVKWPAGASAEVTETRHRRAEIDMEMGAVVDEPADVGDPRHQIDTAIVAS